MDTSRSKSLQLFCISFNILPPATCLLEHVERERERSARLGGAESASEEFSLRPRDRFLALLVPPSSPPLPPFVPRTTTCNQWHRRVAWKSLAPSREPRRREGGGIRRRRCCRYGATKCDERAVWETREWTRLDSLRPRPLSRYASRICDETEVRPSVISHEQEREIERRREREGKEARIGQVRGLICTLVHFPRSE